VPEDLVAVAKVLEVEIRQQRSARRLYRVYLIRRQSEISRLAAGQLER
jgi:hypothetical protein